MKTRRHHNNRGAKQIRGGKTARQVQAMARRLGIPTDRELYYVDTGWVHVTKHQVADPFGQFGAK